jgi:hypothetical protein
VSAFAQEPSRFWTLPDATVVLQTSNESSACS